MKTIHRNDRNKKGRHKCWPRRTIRMRALAPERNTNQQIWFDGAIRIEHATTDNLPDGAPVLPGFVNDGIFWAFVAPLPEDRTRWRRIFLQQNMVRPLGVQDETVNHSRRHELRGKLK